MATIQDLGKVAYLQKGAYNSSTKYEVNDVVTYQGSSYVSKVNNNQGNLPTNTTYWAVVVEKPVKGVDYFTTADKQEMVDEITEDAESEFNQNAQAKTEAFNTNASDKTGAFNNNATSKTSDFNSNASSKTTTFNNNATSKTTDYDTNASNKISDYNTNATNKTNAFDDHVDDKTDEFDGHVEDKTDEFDLHVAMLEEDVEDLRDNQLINDVEEKEIYIEDAAKARVYDFVLEKESSQETTTGKNLYNLTNLEDKTLAGLTFQKNSNSSIKITGTTTGNSSYPGVTSYDLTPMENNTIYTVSYNVEGTYNNMQFIIVSYDENKANSEYINVGQTPTSYTFTATRNGFIRVYFQVTGSGYTENCVIKAQIEEGSTATNWEEYTGGQPSPSPDYPQEVKTVKGYKNLLDIDEEYTFTGNPTLSINIPAGTYYLTNKSAVNSSDTNEVFVRFNDNNVRYNLSENKNIVLTFTDDETAMTLYSKTNAGGSAGISATIKQLMISENELPYVPYGNNYVTVKVVGKNLFDKNNLENGYYTASGVKTSDPGYNKKTIDFIKIIPNKIISFSANVKIYSLTIYEFDANQNWIKRTVLGQSDSKTVLTITPTANTKYIKLGFNYDQTSIITEEMINSLQLQAEYGNARSTYDFYKETNVPIPLNGNEIVGIGNYLDELIVDKEGHCWLNKKTGEKIFDGSETFTMASSVAEGSTRFSMLYNDVYSDSNSSNLDIYVISNKFIGTSWNAIYHTDTINKNLISNYNNSNLSRRFALRIDSTIASTVEGFQTYLQTQYNNETPVIAYYVKSASQLIDLNTTVDLRLFKGVNNITNSEDADMNIRYVQSIQDVIDEIKNAILEIGGGE